MAQKRMFDKGILETDNFMDMPMGTKALYFLLGMEADDEGFVSPKRVMRLYGGNDDDLKVLEAKGFVIKFQTGVIVITNWHENNYLDKNKVKETRYQAEKSLLTLKSNKYAQLNKSLTKVKKSLTQYSIEESSIEENRVEDTISKDIEAKPQYGQEDINWLIGEFESIMKFKSAGGKKDRFMAKHLLNNFSKEQLTTMLVYCATQEYAPRIGSVEKLWYKRGDVIAGIQASNNKNKITVI